MILRSDLNKDHVGRYARNHPTSIHSFHSVLFFRVLLSFFVEDVLGKVNVDRLPSLALSKI